MNFQTFVLKGSVILTSNGLRCQAPRQKQPDQVCNKLIVKKNTLGQLCGAFKCERCGQEIEIELREIPKLT